MSEVKMPQDPTADRLRKLYPANSKLQPPAESVQNKEPQRVKSVVSSSTSIKKDSIGKRIISLFVSEDAEEIKRYLKEDLIIPSIKSGILSALEMIFFHRTSGYGNWRPTDYSKPSQRPTTYSYTSQQNRGYVNAGENRAPSAGIKTIVYKTRMDAEAVLRVLDDQIASYGEATVMQFYDASDVDSQFTDAKWGWKDISTARIYPCPGGFTIQLQKPILLD